MLFANIGYYTNMEDKKDALFKIRRDLSLALKETALSDKLTEPFRIEGVGRFSANDIIIDYLQISCPHNYVLEQKTDAAKEIKP